MLAFVSAQESYPTNLSYSLSTIHLCFKNGDLDIFLADASFNLARRMHQETSVRIVVEPDGNKSSGEKDVRYG